MYQIVTYFRPGTTALLAAVVLCFCAACSDNVPKTVKTVDRTEMPRMYAENVSTLISDSGITRYRITTPAWYIYDKAKEPYWYFPKGIHLERFDDQLQHVDGDIRSNKATYYQYRQLWELDGKVRAINLQRETFESEQLFWNQREQRIYSDTLIKITKPTQILTGKGFDSNQSMTKYQIRQPQGVFPIEEQTQ